MPLTQLAPPYPIFTDKNGDPLDAGYLYFGVVNQNPETNPVQVYWDNMLTQPAAQPIRTINGYPSRNGAPALIYADDRFSVTVRNKRNELVTYSPAGFGVIPFAPVTFATSDFAVKDVATLLADVDYTYAAGVPNTIQVTAGDILRTLAEGFAYKVAASGATDNHVATAGGVKLYVLPGASGYNVKAFGAAGDGVTDDRPAITATLAAMPTGGTLYFPSGNYNMKSIQIGDAAIVLPLGSNLYMERDAWLISTQGIFNPTTGGSFIAPLGDNIIQCNIDGGAYPLTGGNTGTWATWANAGIRCYFNTSIGLGAENVIVKDSEIKNVTYPLQIYGAKKWRVYGNKIHRYKQSGILAGFYNGYDCQYNIFSGNNFEDAGDYAISFFQVGGEAAGTGSYNVVANNVAKNMSQRTNGYAYGVESGDPDYQYGFVFADNAYETTISTGAASLGGITISTTADSIVVGNKLKGALSSNADVGINARSGGGRKARRGLISDNHIEGFRGAGIRVDGHDNVSVRGNVIRNCGDNSSSYPALAVALSDSSTGQVIENNTLIIDSTYPHYGAGTPAIGCLVAASKTVSDVTIRGNTIINPNDYGIYCAGLSGNLIEGVNILNNTIIGTGDATFFQRFPIICDYVNRFSILGNVMREPRRGLVITNSTNGTVGESEIKGSLTLSYLLNIGTATTGLLWRNNECTAALTSVFAPASGSGTQFTTPANNNRAVGGSGLVSGAKGKTAAIASGATVTHGLSLTPTFVSLTAATSGASDVHVSAISSTTFTVTFSGGGNEEFYWEARF